jgi:hypothetical protein
MRNVIAKSSLQSGSEPWVKTEDENKSISTEVPVTYLTEEQSKKF